MLDTGGQMLDTGWQMLDTRYWMLDTRCWIQQYPVSSTPQFLNAEGVVLVNFLKKWLKCAGSSKPRL